MELKTCPFCGIKPNIVQDESNQIWYIEHYHKTPGVEGCPIAQYKYDDVGIYDYDTEKQASEAWNQRKG